MSEHPILFKQDMVKAILTGRKTQTRRVIDPQSLLDRETRVTACYKCPYGSPGDLLWVREKCAIGFNDDSDLVVDYHADGKRRWFDVTPENERYSLRYINDDWRRPSIHMPRWACRILLRVVDVRVERLNEISEEDTIAELGIPEKWAGTEPEPYKRNIIGSFSVLWDSINGRGAWALNPWVWVIEFKIAEVKS